MLFAGRIVLVGTLRGFYFFFFWGGGGGGRIGPLGFVVLWVGGCGVGVFWSALEGHTVFHGVLLWGGRGIFIGVGSKAKERVSFVAGMDVGVFRIISGSEGREGLLIWDDWFKNKTSPAVACRAYIRITRLC